MRNDGKDTEGELRRRVARVEWVGLRRFIRFRIYQTPSLFRLHLDMNMTKKPFSLPCRIRTTTRIFGLPQRAHVERDPAALTHQSGTHHTESAM